MMHGREKSDLAIVAMKPANKRTSPLRRHLQGQAQRSRWSEGRGPRGMRTSKARTGLRARLACHRRWSVYGKQLPSYTRGGRSYGVGAAEVVATFIVHTKLMEVPRGASQ